MDEWLSPFFASVTPTAFRTCFRLEPPDLESLDVETSAPEEVGDSGSGRNSDGNKEREREKKRKAASQTWMLRFFLQAAEDPSLLVPASRVWKESGRVLEFLNRRFEDPQERFLLQGRTREDIMDALRKRRASADQELR